MEYEDGVSIDYIGDGGDVGQVRKNKRFISGGFITSFRN